MNIKNIKNVKPFFDRFEQNIDCDYDVFVSIQESVQNILSEFIKYDKHQVSYNDMYSKQSDWIFDAMDVLRRKEPRLIDPRIRILRFNEYTCEIYLSIAGEVQDEMISMELNI